VEPTTFGSGWLSGVLSAALVLFGTAHLPDRWPAAYGISGGTPPPEGYWRQLLWPFRSRR
jgi:hypothetical protein